MSENSAILPGVYDGSFVLRRKDGMSGCGNGLRHKADI